jgi:hypothetical protein
LGALDVALMWERELRPERVQLVDGVEDCRSLPGDERSEFCLGVGMEDDVPHQQSITSVL